MGGPHIAHFAMCAFSRRPGCIEITIKLGGKTLALLSKRYYLTHKSNGAYSAHTFAKNANVWGTRHANSSRQEGFGTGHRSVEIHFARAASDIGSCRTSTGNVRRPRTLHNQ